MKSTDFRWILQQTRPYKRCIIQNLLIVVAIVIINSVVPLTNRELVNVGVLANNGGFVVAIISVQAALYCLLIALHFLRNEISSRASNDLVIKMVGEFMRHVVRLPMSYFNKCSTGDLVERIKDFERIQKFASVDLMEIMATVISILSLAPILFWINWKLFAVFAATAVVYMLYIISHNRKRKIINSDRFRADAKSRAAEIGIIDAIQDIKIAGQEYASLREWERVQIETLEARLRAASLQSRQAAAGNGINRIGLLLISFIAAHEVIVGGMTLGDLTITATISMQLNFHIGHVLDFVAGWHDTLGALRRANELRQLQVEVPRRECCVAGPVPTSISVRNIRFCYPGTTNGALQGLALDVEEGEIVALVGPSGSGKSTLLKLLLKLYAPDSGEILIGSKNISDLDVFRWREQVAAVMQNGALFANTIRENVVAGQPVDEHWLGQVVSVAQLEDVIESLPHGLETRVGPNGERLSAGQMQRVLIARAIYKRPSLLLFDEATSALDTVNEARILSKLRSVLPRSTIVVVAHRLSAIKDVDRIFVVERGAVTEAGSHAELMMRDGFYAELVNACL